MEARSGILLVNKEMNMTSFDVVNKLRRKLMIKSIGHTGTLDPNATGLLVCLIGNATKIQPYLKSEKKTYEACLKLGIKTNTGDIWGEIIQTDKLIALNEELVKSTLNSFLGKSFQTPPMTSAIKVHGKKLYEYQREGVEIEREKREIYIDSINLNCINDDEISFTAEVSSGTYIRTLCEDIAEKLNTVGTMSKLNRTKTSKFDIKDSYRLDEISFDTPLIPIKTILDLPFIEYDNTSDIFNGRAIRIDSDADLVLIGHNDLELAIYRKDNDVYRCERGLW